MANANTPMGLKPIRHKNGGCYEGQANLYHVRSDYATALFIGDPVIVTGNADVKGVPDVQIATAGATNKITGVIVGFKPNPTNLELKHGPASTDRYVLVCDDPSVIFEVCTDATANVAATDVSTNINFAAGGGGSTTTGKSSWVAATASMAADATYQGTIERIVNREDNEIGTAYTKLEVSINLHQKMSYAIAGI